jgi:hypothetical protein
MDGPGGAPRAPNADATANACVFWHAARLGCEVFESFIGTV